MSEGIYEGFEPKALPPSREILSEPASLRTFLTHTLQDPGYVRPDRMPHKIDLGEFNTDISRIRTLTENDPNHLEYGTLLLLHEKTGQYSFSDTIQGIGDAVVYQHELLPHQTIAAEIHSHGVHDLPFSPADIANLFASKSLPLPPPVSIITSPSANMLVARTEETPLQFTDDITFHGMNEVRERMHWLTRMAQKYQLKIYSSSPDQHILSQAS